MRIFLHFNHISIFVENQNQIKIYKLLRFKNHNIIASLFWFNL